MRPALLLPLLLGACSWLLGEQLTAETVAAGCGLCLYKQEARGCYWAIQWEGEVYAVNGGTPADHDAHGPEGMCRMERRAVVTGRLRDGQLFAERFDLLPVEPGAIPASEGHAHEHGTL